MFNYLRSIIASLLISIGTFVSPVKKITPTPPPKIGITITPKATLTVIPTPTVITPSKITPLTLSQRAFRVAKFIYSITDVAEKEELRSNHGVNKSTNEQEIIDHASWYEKNPDVLSMNENRMNTMISGGSGGSGTVSQQVQDLENKVQNAEDCKRQMDQYTDCINQYNEDLKNYSDSLDTDSWRHGIYSLKPNNYCSKPICSY